MPGPQEYQPSYFVFGGRLKHAGRGLLARQVAAHDRTTQTESDQVHFRIGELLNAGAEGFSEFFDRCAFGARLGRYGTRSEQLDADALIFQHRFQTAEGEGSRRSTVLPSVHED